MKNTNLKIDLKDEQMKLKSNDEIIRRINNIPDNQPKNTFLLDSSFQMPILIKTGIISYLSLGTLKY